jgi:hypothetical protein
VPASAAPERVICVASATSQTRAHADDSVSANASQMPGPNAEIRAQLVGMTSASAAAYVAKKAVSPALVKVTAVSPQKGQRIRASRSSGPASAMPVPVTTSPLM